MAILYADVICEKTVKIPQPTLSNVRAAEESVIGITPNLKDDNASTNVSINDNDNDEFSEGVYDEHQAKKNLGTKRKINFQEALHLEKRKIKLMEERLTKKSQADKDYMCLMNLIPDDIQKLELRIEFLSNVTRRIQISNNLSPPVNSVPTTSNISCPSTPSPHVASLNSTHSCDSDTSAHSSRTSFISSTDLLPRQSQVHF